MPIKAIIICKSQMRKLLSEHWLYLILLIGFAILGAKALIHPGLFTAHDIWHQVVRLYYYSQGVNDGQFPPYWISQLANNFGYPLFFFSYHLPWIIGVLLLKLGFDIPNTIKILFFLSYIASGITMYFFVKNLLRNRFSGLISGIIYLWLPYHFFIIFVGGSMGIAFVFAFLPLLFLGIHLIKEESKFGIPILAIGLSGIILSHIMHLIFLSPIILIFLLWELTNVQKRINFLKNISLGLVLGILVSSFYLIPALYYNQFTKAHQETGFSELYKRNFINFNQLIYSKWGFGPIVNNAKNGENSFQLGLAQWISMIFLVLLIFFKKISKNYQSLSTSLVIAFTISIFLMLDWSKSIWSIITKFVIVDFPFRLLLPATFIASISTGIVLQNIGKWWRNLVFFAFIFIAIYTNRNHLNVNQYTNFPISSYLNIETEVTTNAFNEYLPIQAEAKLLNKPWNEIVGENLSASGVKKSTNQLLFNINVIKEGTASTGQFYFPGQTLYLDDRVIKFSTDKEGRISFIAPQGNHTVAVRYQETQLIKISQLLSIVGFILIIALFIKPNL